MTKEDRFLWIVQTVMIHNAVNLASQTDGAEKYRHVFSGTGAFGICDDALWASGRIPPHLSASEAANEFLTFMLANWRDLEEAAHGKSLVVPAWFSR